MARRCDPSAKSRRTRDDQVVLFVGVMVAIASLFTVIFG